MPWLLRLYWILCTIYFQIDCWLQSRNIIFCHYKLIFSQRWSIGLIKYLWRTNILDILNATRLYRSTLLNKLNRNFSVKLHWFKSSQSDCYLLPFNNISHHNEKVKQSLKQQWPCDGPWCTREYVLLSRHSNARQTIKSIKCCKIVDWNIISNFTENVLTSFTDKHKN